MEFAIVCKVLPIRAPAIRRREHRIDGDTRFSYAEGRMLIPVLLALLLALGSTPASAQSATLDAGSGLEQTLRDISSFSPRLEGSSGEKQLLSWIESRLASLQVSATTFDFSQSDFEHSFSSNLRVDLPGGSRDTVIVAVPLDSPPDGAPAGDGAIDIALALDLIRQVKAVPAALTITVLFLGAEYGDSAAYPMGSTLFLRDFQPDYRAAVLYLNLRGVPGRVLVRGGGRGIVSPYWLMNRCVNALETAKVPFTLQGENAQIFRMGTTDERTIIEPYLTAGYPAVGLEGDVSETSPVPEAQMLASFSTFLRGFVDAGASGIPEEWDKHYLILQQGSWSFIVDEKVYVGLVFGILALTLLYSLIFRKGLKKYVRTLTRNAWAIIPLAGLCFLFLVAGTFVVEGLLGARGFPSLWQYSPLAFLGLKIIVALFLYAALYNVFRRMPFPRNGSFYSAAALFFLLIDIVVVAAFNISFTFYFLWAFIFVFLSAVVPNRWAKALLFLPAPFWGLRGIITVFLSPALPFCRFILLSPLWGNLLVAGACLPFILVLMRIGLIFPGRGILRRRRRELAAAVVLLIGGGTLSYMLYTYSPFTAAHPQPIVATQTISVAPDGATLATALAIDSSAPLGPLSLRDRFGPRFVNPSLAEVAMVLPDVESPLQIDQSSVQFLRQRNVTLRVSMPSPARLMNVTLASAVDFILYDSSFPAVRESPREYQLLIGAFPPAPLSLQLSLPADSAFTLTFTVEFDAPLKDTDLIGRPDTNITTRVRVVRKVDVKT